MDSGAENEYSILTGSLAEPSEVVELLLLTLSPIDALIEAVCETREVDVSFVANLKNLGFKMLLCSALTICIMGCFLHCC